MTGARDVEVKSLSQGSLGVTEAIEKQLKTDVDAIEAEAKTVRDLLEASSGESAGEDDSLPGAGCRSYWRSRERGPCRCAQCDARRCPRGDATRAQSMSIESAAALSGAETDTITAEASDSLRQLEMQYDSQKNDLKAEADQLVKRINGITSCRSSPRPNTAS